MEVVSGRWSSKDALLSINARELLVVERSLLHFLPLLVGSTVSLFVDNSMAVAYLRHSLSLSERNCSANPSLGGGTSDRSSPSVHHGPEQGPRRCPVSSQPGSGIRVDTEDGALALLAGHDGPVCHLSKQALGTDARLHSWDHLQVYAFPPWALIPQVTHKLCSSEGVLMTLIAPYWP